MQKKLYELKENPLSTAIYGEAEDVSDLVKSIKETGLLTPLLIKSDGTILSGHRRYRAARQAGLILVNVEVRDPKDKSEEELIIISANKQREKTASQRLREIERLRAIYEDEGRERISEVTTRSNVERVQNPAFLETKKAEKKPDLSIAETEFNIEEIYEGAIERTAEKESQMQHSAIESTPSAAQSPPLERQSPPKPAPINMHKRIAKELGISTNQLHQLQTVGEAAKAGVPEAQDALKRADAGEITLNRAYELTKQATKPKSSVPIPFSGGEKVEPGMAQDCMSAALKVNPWVLGIERDITQAEPKVSVGEAKQLLAFIGTHIGLLEGFRQSLRDYIEKRGGYQNYSEEESD